jgi:hypothetical protein
MEFKHSTVQQLSHHEELIVQVNAQMTGLPKAKRGYGSRKKRTLEPLKYPADYQSQLEDCGSD